jgi:hypothetical protein
VERVVQDYMEWVYDKMQDKEYYPDVIVPFFGRFSLDHKKIRNKILRRIRRYKEGKATREDAVKYIEELRPVYRRLIEYHYRSKRYKTFNGKRIKRKKPLWWQKKYIPHIWPELELPPATVGKYAGKFDKYGRPISGEEE